MAKLPETANLALRRWHWLSAAHAVARTGSISVACAELAAELKIRRESTPMWVPFPLSA
jgi:hypothetical protein